MEKCEIGNGWFYVEGKLVDELKKKTEETIKLLENAGYKVKISKPNIKTYDVGVLWIVAKKAKKEHFTFGFHFDKSTKELLRTFFTVQIEAGDSIWNSMVNKYGNNSIESGDKIDLFYPLAYIKKERVRLLYT